MWELLDEIDGDTEYVNASFEETTTTTAAAATTTATTAVAEQGGAAPERETVAQVSAVAAADALRQHQEATDRLTALALYEAEWQAASGGVGLSVGAAGADSYRPALNGAALGAPAGRHNHHHHHHQNQHKSNHLDGSSLPSENKRSRNPNRRMKEHYQGEDSPCIFI